MALKTQVSKVETQLNDHAKLLQTADATHASQMSDLENRLKSGNDTIQAGMAAIEAEIQGNKNDLVALNNRITAVEATGGTVDPTAIMNTIKTTVDTSIKDTKIEAADKLTALETRIRDDLVKLHGMIPKEGSKGWMGNSSSKPILEYKAILNLATLKSDKTEYREWSDKLKNAMLQIRPGSRVFLTEVERCPLMQSEPKVGELTTIFDKHRLTIGQSYDQFKTDLYTVLIEKTTGEAS